MSRHSAPDPIAATVREWQMVTLAREMESDSFDQTKENAYQTRAARRQRRTGAVGARVERRVTGEN